MEELKKYQGFLSGSINIQQEYCPRCLYPVSEDTVCENCGHSTLETEEVKIN
ncbi:MAG: hypothetical protein WC549_00550 [Actinomycetota bacterium]